MLRSTITTKLKPNLFQSEYSFRIMIYSKPYHVMIRLRSDTTILIYFSEIMCICVFFRYNIFLFHQSGKQHRLDRLDRLIIIIIIIITTVSNQFFKIPFSFTFLRLRMRQLSNLLNHPSECHSSLDFPMVVSYHRGITTTNFMEYKARRLNCTNLLQDPKNTRDSLQHQLRIRRDSA